MKLFLILFWTLLCISQSLIAETESDNYFKDLNLSSRKFLHNATHNNNDVNRLKNVLLRARQALLTYMPEAVKEIYPNAKITLTQNTQIKFISIIDSNTGVRIICIRGNSNPKIGL